MEHKQQIVNQNLNSAVIVLLLKNFKRTFEGTGEKSFCHNYFDILPIVPSLKKSYLVNLFKEGAR